MTKLETNVFSITNLNELSSNYRLYCIKGLRPDHDEYYSNRQHIIRKLSYNLKSPITIIDKENVPYLVVNTDIDDIPFSLPLVRSMVQFQPLEEEFTLDYTLRTPENDAICLRFLQFMLQAPLRRNNELWQPGAGQPFFWKEPSFSTSRLNRHTGFSVRAIVTHDGGLGFCVDVTSKFVSKNPLPLHLKRNEFWQYKGQNCIYHYGHQWFNIQMNELSDFNVSEHLVRDDNDKFVSLIDYISRESSKPISSELAQLPHDASVVLYSNNSGEERSAPAPLCYPVYGSNDKEVRRQHRYTILKPHVRHQLIHDFATRYLTKLNFGNQRVQVSSIPIKILRKRYAVPDLLFGNGKVLSTRGTKGAIQIDINELGKARKDLLLDNDAGFFIQDPLYRQYLILPQSVFDSFGTSFIEDLTEMVNSLFPQQNGYSPIIVKYNDRVPKTFFKQGNAILEAIESNCIKPGYALIMIHHMENRKIREEDQLEAMVIRECRERDVTVAVIHSEVGQECYRLVTPANGTPYYSVRNNKRGILAGYLRNVSINHILLNNERWPFVLSTPLNADITIGIDVKHNTAGLLVVGKRGARVGTLRRTSRQKERLLSEQIQAYLIEILRHELIDRTNPIRNIVIHRDGRVFQSEIDGCKAAIAQLIQEDILEPSVELTIIEIPKTSPVRMRLFDVSTSNAGRKYIYNPHEGDYYIIGNEGYLCSTGKVFLRNGSAQPLHIRKVYGSFPLDKCLEDIYYMTALTWTRPEGCMRDPITTKLNDRFLREEATDYDSDGLEFATYLADEVTT